MDRRMFLFSFVDLTLILIGNKADSIKKREVSFKEINQLAQKKI